MCRTVEREGAQSIASRARMRRCNAIRAGKKKWAALQRPECVDFQLYARKLKAGLRACVAETRLVRLHSYRAHIMLTSRQRANKKILPREPERPARGISTEQKEPRELIAEHAIFSVHVLTI